jgi:TolB protein
LNKVYDFDGGVRVSRDARTLALSRFGWTGADFHEVENPGVWTLDAEGKGEMRRVSDFGGLTFWSPDSKQLIVARLSKPNDNKSRSETWRINVDGSGASKLPIPETEEVDDWSPDGHWLVTVSDRHPTPGSGYQLYVMRPDGTNERRLTEGGGLNVHPRFSADSRRIAYLHQEHGTYSLWVANIDGTNRRQVLAEENDTCPSSVCWSPDGKSLAYTLYTWQRDEKGTRFISDLAKTNARIAIMDANGKNSHPLNLPHALWLSGPDWR